MTEDGATPQLADCASMRCWPGGPLIGNCQERLS